MGGEARVIYPTLTRKNVSPTWWIIGRLDHRQAVLLRIGSAHENRFCKCPSIAYEHLFTSCWRWILIRNTSFIGQTCFIDITNKSLTSTGHYTDVSVTYFSDVGYWRHSDILWLCYINVGFWSKYASLTSPTCTRRHLDVNMRHGRLRHALDVIWTSIWCTFLMSLVCFYVTLTSYLVILASFTSPICIWRHMDVNVMYFSDVDCWLWQTSYFDVLDASEFGLRRVLYLSELRHWRHEHVIDVYRM